MLQASAKIPELGVNKAIWCTMGNKLVWHYTEKHGKLVNIEVAAAEGRLLLIRKLLYLWLVCVCPYISAPVEQIYSQCNQKNYRGSEDDVGKKKHKARDLFFHFKLWDKQLLNVPKLLPPFFFFLFFFQSPFKEL